MGLFRNRRRQVPAPVLYDRCGCLFADNRLLVNVSDGWCDGYLGLVSPSGEITYELTFYSGMNGYYTLREHPGAGPATESLMHPDGRFTQQGVLPPALAESILIRFTPARLNDRTLPS